MSWLHVDMFRKSVIHEIDGGGLRQPTAVVDWEMRGHESFPGLAEVRTGVLTLVLVRRGNQWQIVAAQNTDLVKVPVGE